MLKRSTKSTAGEMAFKTMAPAALGQILGSLEVLSTLKDYEPDGVLAGGAAAKPSRIPQKMRRILDMKEAVAALQIMNLSGATLVLLGKQSRKAQIIGAALSLVGNRIFEYRNPYGRDGADQMSGVIWTYRIATAVIPHQKSSDDLFLRAVNLQTLVSYVASGSAKAMSSTWLSGDAMGKIVSTDIYGNTPFAALLNKYPFAGKLISWSTIAWETGFPIVYFLPEKERQVALSVVKGFHAGVAATMGLPRFFWGFSAAHAAVEYVASRTLEVNNND